jgi:hypothetical protein
MSDSELAAPICSRFHVSRKFGHPWTREDGWDLLEIKADSEERLSEMIAKAEKKFWQIWIRDNTGQITVAMYKPSGANEKWVDPIYLAN